MRRTRAPFTRRLAELRHRAKQPTLAACAGKARDLELSGGGQLRAIPSEGRSGGRRGQDRTETRSSVGARGSDSHEKSYRAREFQAIVKLCMSSVSVEFCQFRPNSAHTRPKLARLWANSTQIGLDLGKPGPNSTQVGPKSTKFGPKSPSINRNSPEFD